MATGLYVGNTPIGKVNVGTFSENGYDTSSSTMDAEDLLVGKTGFNATGKITGTMPNNGNVTKNLNTTTTEYAIPKGYHGGSGKVSINLENKTVTPTDSKQVITPTNGSVLSSVTINATPDKTIDATLTSNAQMLAPYTAYSKGVKYTGSIQSMNGGTYTVNQTVPTKGKYLTSDIIVNVPASGITPSGTIDITTNGIHNVTNYANANVNVPSSEPVLHDKTITPSETIQTVFYDNGYDGLSNVTVNAISKTYVGSGIARKSSADLTTNGAIVSVPSGYYANAVNKSVATATQSTPTIDVSNTGLISAVSIQNTGYVTGGTKTGTKQLATQAGEVVTSNKVLSTKGKYMTGDIVINVPTGGGSEGIGGGEYNVFSTDNGDGTQTISIVDAESNTISLETKTVNPTTSEQIVTASEGYDGLESVIVTSMPTGSLGNISVDSNGLVSSSVTTSGYLDAQTKTLQLTTQTGTTVTENKTLSTKGKFMTGDIVINVPASGITPSGTINITENGTHDVAEYANANVNVKPTLEQKSVTPTTSQQIITAGVGYDGLSQVTVESMPAGTLSKPTINTSTGVVTAKVGTSGYLSSDTQATLNLATKGTATITPSETAQTITAGQYLTGVQTISAIPSTYVGSGVTRKAATEIIPTENIQTISANQYLTGVQTIKGIPSDYIGSAVKVQNFMVDSTIPDASQLNDGDLFLLI